MFRLNITFAPTAKGLAVATLRVGSDDPYARASANTLQLRGVGLAPSLSATPDPINFGSVDLASGARTAALRIYNSGRVAVVINAFDFVGTGASAFSLVGAPATPYNMRAVAYLYLTVRFAPTSAIAHSVKLFLRTSGGDFDVDLTGTGIAAVLGAPSSVDFGNPQTGQSVVRNLTINNTGTTALRVFYATFVPDASVFSGAGTSLLVQPGQQANILLTMLTSIEGAFNQSLLLYTSDPRAAPRTIFLTGVTLGPQITIAGVIDAPSGKVRLLDMTLAEALAQLGDIVYPEVNVVGGTYGKLFNISNQGLGTLIISSVAVNSPDFVIRRTGVNAWPSGSVSISPNGFRMLLVVFDPTSSGYKDATLTLVSNDASGSVSLRLMGTAVAGSADLSPDFIVFDTRASTTASAPLKFDFANTGSLPVTVSQIALSSSAAFAIVNDTGEVTLQQNEVRSIFVVFTPPSAGTFSAVLTVTANDEALQHTSTMRGSSFDVQLVNSPTSINFGIFLVSDFSVGKSAILTVRNTAVLVSESAMHLARGGGEHVSSVDFAPDSVCPTLCRRRAVM